MRAILRLLGLALLGACTAAPRSAAAPAPEGRELATWGTMREVLREGRSEARVRLADVVGPRTVAVGALAGLAGEVAVIAGEAHVARVDPAAPGGLRVRPLAAEDRAALLVLADVASWTERALPEVADLDQLEVAVRAAAAAEGIDAARPFPFRVEGTASLVQLHVLDGACPYADPDGPPPWRVEGTGRAVALVGFHAEGREGELTHHGRRSHVHAILDRGSIAGHLDEVALEPGARLLLPRAP